MLREYELTILTVPSKHKEAMDKVIKLLDDNRDYVKIVKFGNEGTKRIPYQVKNHEYATYTYFVLEMDVCKCPPSCLSADLNRIDELLRYLFVLAK